MNELNELRDQAYENSLIYKEKTKKIHDSKIKNRVFNVGDRVLLFNSRLKIFSGKLKTRWTGPFTIAQVFPYGTVELSQTDRLNFKVNGHRLKHYFGGGRPPRLSPDFEDSRAVFCPSFTQASILSMILGIQYPKSYRLTFIFEYTYSPRPNVMIQYTLITSNQINMDLMIPLGQKNTLAEYMILSSADNRPLMLDKDLYDS
ncbi:hypothetical protein Tco_0955581 [Tanacetum coccineum]|uniref:Reverse transcriptase domain-containing protein n=1 Tax=Tanacetum coccineum TaxID=301880 RepID=A0ABQ5E7N9_9ASTR